MGGSRTDGARGAGTAAGAHGEFITPAGPCTYEHVIKKSRFIGHLAPVTSVAEAEARLAAVREAHRTATHNCYAYTVGIGVPVERFSDDGEPSGTAGRPILEVIRRRGLANALLVVTRYFGGTLLGANGLVRAYSDTAAGVIDTAELLTCRRMCRVDVRCGYAQFGKLEYELAQAGYVVLDKSFTEDVAMTVLVPAGAVVTFTEQVMACCSGRCTVDARPPEYVGLTPDGRAVFGVWPGP
ncbi:hypothetical protein GCM10010885_23820 [Alicyclobacillus cellulosilyticus]|uniref:YigZ family protein n=1 Tax=Alicyclobacillus cellulosilyticus TaxID=1003997 RepID=A0A917NNL8_9BACL|nr:YigZ family protein [Alicyclobacillus cellulosilyticus]GGJ13713.1 hypothetical protein GCM10010885_23820 [Alicyclobacillus cellulosilyticus]